MEAADLKLMVAWRNQPDIARNFFNCWPIAYSEQPRWYERYLTSPAERQFMIDLKLTIKDKKPEEPNRTIGTLALVDISHQHQSAELGRVLLADSQYRGKRYMEEAIGLIKGFAFDDVNLHRLFVSVFADNDKAVNLYKRCGFIGEGILRDHVWKGGRFRDVAILSVLRETK